MKKKLLILSIFLFSFFMIYKYVYKDHRDIGKERASYVVNSINFSNEFSLDAEAASLKYLDKTIQISGEITEITDDFITINDKIVCYVNKSLIDNSLLNSQIIIKGRCIGFDELMEEIKLDECTIIN